MVSHFLAAYLATFLTAAGQTLLKTSALRSAGRPWYALYLHPAGIAAYALFLPATLASLYAYQVLPLRFAAVVLPSTYIFVGIFAIGFLGERLTRLQWLGAILVFAGIIIFNS